MKVRDVSGLDAFSQDVDVGCEFDPLLFHGVARAADRSGTVISVFHNGVSGSGNYETGRSGNVERVFPIATSTYNINGLVLF
ncbi:hypothetical protein SDC9_203250 [bioreactor metagenome]|uniref:Uncharacterized protein n=1 Tax=bioreactor metagenome TaxID=1076179 RepID=A0A645IWJ7_9ZZZZ